MPGFPSRPLVLLDPAHSDVPRRRSGTPALRGEQHGVDGLAHYGHSHLSRALGSATSLFQTIHAVWIQTLCLKSESRTIQGQNGWRGLKQNPAVVGAGSQPGLQPQVSLTCKSINTLVLLLLEKKLLEVRGLLHHEVQFSKASECISGLLSGSKARSGC